MDKYYMTTKEVAEFFGRSEQTVLNWKKKKPDFPAPAIRSCPNQYRTEDIMHYAANSCA